MEPVLGIQAPAWVGVTLVQKQTDEIDNLSYIIKT